MLAECYRAAIVGSSIKTALASQHAERYWVCKNRCHNTLLAELCSLEGQQEKPPPPHTHSGIHMLGHPCVVPILPWLLWAWQARDDPRFMGVERPACLGADNCPSCQTCCTPYIKFAPFSLMAPNIPCLEYRITTCIKLQWCYLAWSNSSALQWVPGDRIHFPLHQLYGQLCLWKCQNPEILWFDWNRGRGNDTCWYSLISNYLPSPTFFFFFWNSRQKSLFLKLVFIILHCLLQGSGGNDNTPTATLTAFSYRRATSSKKLQFP